MSLRKLVLFVAGLLLATPLSVQAGTPSESSQTVYELRTYTTFPGKMPDLNKRFRDHTMRLFEKHGIKNIGYWVPIDKPDTLVYLIAHKSREAADKSWAAFRADEEWKLVSKESERNGRIVKRVDRQYLSPTDYSPLK
jgi:NIPSNAP